MLYIKDTWIHNKDEYPTTFYYEIADDGYDTRRIMFYRDGRIVKASADSPDEVDLLSDQPFPPLAEILANNSETLFAVEISREDFELLWYDL